MLKFSENTPASMWPSVSVCQRALEPPDVHHERLLPVSVAGLLVNLVGIFAFQHGGHGHSHGEGGNTPEGLSLECLCRSWSASSRFRSLDPVKMMLFSAFIAVRAALMPVCSYISRAQIRHGVLERFAVTLYLHQPFSTESFSHTSAKLEYGIFSVNYPALYPMFFMDSWALHIKASL